MSRSCSVDTCLRPAKTKGLCNTHYERLRRTGSLILDPRRRSESHKTGRKRCHLCGDIVHGQGLCSKHYQASRRPASVPRVERGCDVPSCHRRHNARGLCATHYGIAAREGRLPPVTPRPSGPSSSHRAASPFPCTVSDCERPQAALAVCAMHYRRLRRNGTTDPLPRSESYVDAHKYVRRVRGKASQYPCVDCGIDTGRREWSYSYAAGPLELVGENGCAYSMNPNDYKPRCVKCHRSYDRRMWRRLPAEERQVLSA